MPAQEDGHETASGPIGIRPARLADVPALARLMEQLGYPTSPDEMRARLIPILADADYETLVAEQAGDVVGMIGLRLGRHYERNGAVGQIMALVVEERQRGQRVGAALLDAGETWLHERGVRAIIVNSSHRRVAAHRFYQRHGYAATGLRFVRTLK